MKNILIPTDFNPASLACISDLCRQNQDHDLQLIFIHFFKISDSISELLMLSRRNREYEYITDEFYHTCDSLKATFPHVKAIKIEFFYGSTLRILKVYLEENLINAVLDLKNCSLKPLNKLSVNPHHLIGKSGLEVIEITPELSSSTNNYVFEQQLTEAV